MSSDLDVPVGPLAVRFWGVRGSLPTPGPATLRYGGDTPCLEILVDGTRVVIDCGSGARRLGLKMLGEPPGPLDILFTHSHLDHICGLPFFKPAYNAACNIKLWAGHLRDAQEHQEVLARLMSPPIFPLPTSALRACQFRAFDAGRTITLQGGLEVDTVRLNHPGGATGYRFRHAGHSLCVITDHEHGNPEIDAEVAAFVAGADIMIYDAMYTALDYPRYAGWGHSTWEEATALAKRAGVRTPVIFHHDPTRSDDALDEIAAAAADAYAGTMVAREGLVLSAGR